MSQQHSPKPAANARPKYGPPVHRGPGGHGGSGEKAVNFLPSLRRLAGQLGPELSKIATVVLMIIVGTIANSVGPAILGNATDLIYNATVIDKTPIDFMAVARVLLGATAVYLVYFLLAWSSAWMINGIVQRSIYRMRQQVSDKLTRLPLKYFDGQPRGELLSRVTNDVDNISQTLQQTLSQILTNLFTLIGVLVMMFYISWILALVALISIPVGMVVTMVIGKRS